MNPLAIFSGPYALLAKWGVIAVLVAAFAAFFWFKGNEHGTQKLIDYQAAQAREQIRIVKGREVVTTTVVTKYIKVKGDTVTVTKNIEKEVGNYASTNTGLCLDPAWRWLHDAAAANVVPDPGLKPDGKVGAPEAATAIQTVTENYAACHRTADRLDALQDWVREQGKVH